MKTVTTYPMEVFLLEIPVHQHPCTQGGTNPTNIYNRYTSFPNYVNFQLYLDIFGAR